MASVDPSAPPHPDDADGPRPGSDVWGAEGSIVSTDTLDAGGETPSTPPLSRRERRRRRKAAEVSKWDRPPPPIDWRWFVGHTGRVLIAVGLLMFGFVAYQLWGTAIETARAQRSLESDFEEMLAEVEPVEPTAATGDRDNEASADDGEATATADGDEATTDNDGETTGDGDVATGDDGGETTGDDDVATGDDGGETTGDDDGATATKNKKNQKKKAAAKEKKDAEAAAAADTDDAPGTTVPTAVPVADQNIPLIEEGDALARLEIPRIDVDHIVVAGVSTGDLKKGPGHYPDTPIPGQLGNSAIAGHRTTYGQPFYSIEQLEPGDEIIVTTLSGRFVYRVTGQEIVGPSDYEVVATVDPDVANLTLTSCHPRWTAQQRIVIFSELVGEQSAPVGEPVRGYGRPPAEETVADEPEPVDTGRPERDDPVLQADTDTATQDEPAEETEVADTIAAAPTENDQVDNTAIADAFAEGWFSDPGAPLHVGLWGLALAAIGVGAYLLSRAARRDWVGGVIGILPFLVALYFFYQNVNRLLPPNL